MRRHLVIRSKCVLGLSDLAPPYGGPILIYLADPITVGGVANIHGLSAFDAVYSTVRGKPFAAR